MCTIAGRMVVELAIYRDHGISGAKGRAKRPALDRICKHAAQRQFDTVMA
jgi:DNA invertase Pin-like site-specific DNA recombinase